MSFLTFLAYLLLLLNFQLTDATTGIPVATSYQAFGPLPFTSNSRNADPLSSIPSHSLFSTLLSLHKFPSESAVGGYATWRSCTTNSTNGIVTAPFSDVDPHMSYQAWAVGNFTVEKDHVFPRLIQCSDPTVIRPIRRDDADKNDYLDTVCPPDLYADGRALCSIRLKRGNYNIFVNLVDRSNHTMFLCNYFTQSSYSNLLVQINDTVLPHVIVDRSNSKIRASLAGPYCSVTLMNIHDSMWATGGTAQLVDPPAGLYLRQHTSADDHYPLPRIAPKQIRQLRIDLRATSSFLSEYSQNVSLPKQLNVSIAISYDFVTGTRNQSIFHLSLDVSEWGKLRAYHFTYLDVDSSVQAAAVLPPKHPCTSNNENKQCSVLLSTHGAGVNALSSAWTDSYQVQDYSWVLLPTGRRKYGLNWEGPQMRSAITALKALGDQMPGVPADQVDDWKVKKDFWLQAGHSMGGHGALLLSTHFPDMLVAALPAMGWLRLGTYDSQQSNEDIVYSDASERALLAVASAEFNADMYAENLLGIPFLARVGSDDDNVPPSNLRKFCRLLKENEFFHNITKSVVILSEIPGKGHWFNGVVDDDILQPFISKHLAAKHKPRLPKQFSLFSINPASTGSRGGFRIMSLEVPFDISRVSVHIDEHETGTWKIDTLNVRRLRYQPVAGIIDRPERVLIDTMGEPISISASTLETQKRSIDFCVQRPRGLNPRVETDQRLVTWKVCRDAKKWGTVKSKERGPDNSGPAFQVFSERKVTIVYPEDDKELQDTAVSLSNALYIRGISAQVTTDSDVSRGQISSSGDINIVLLGGPNMNRMASKLYSDGYSADVTFDENVICISARKCFSEPGTGIAFLSNGPGRTLIFYTAGTDRSGLLSVLSFIPRSPASNTPEWVIVSKKKGWGFRGLGGVIALGYWNYLWKFEPRRTYPAQFLSESVNSEMMYQLQSVLSPFSRWQALSVITILCILAITILLWKRRKFKNSYLKVEQQEFLETGNISSTEQIQAEKDLFIPPERES